MPNKEYYVNHVNGFNEFFEREGVEHMSSAVPVCGKCNVKAPGECPECGESVCVEPYFSWQRCGCCGDSHGGNREDYVAYNFGDSDDKMVEVSICEDCVYWNEYGRLPDMDMLEIDRDERPAVVNGETVTLFGPVDGSKLKYRKEDGTEGVAEAKDITFPE